MTKSRNNAIIDGLMDIVFAFFEREEVSEGEGIAALLTITSAILANDAQNVEHLERGLKIAHDHIERVSRAYFKLNDEPVEERLWKH